MPVSDTPTSTPTLAGILGGHLQLAKGLRELAEDLDGAEAELVVAAADALEGLCAGTRNREAIIAALRDALAERPAPARPGSVNDTAPPPAL